MLEIKNITKVYNTGGFKQKALDGVTVNFRESEFAAILGPSGSGKTTFLNIIGGLDHYTNGDLIINEISTKKYKDSDWDSYRNHRIGFVFQNYNLITHQSILSNVILALTLSGISKKEAISRSKKALKEVGLEKHMNKLPNQLSGGQMQRVAIARALVNDPDILLADEPTGALDSETSVQIMELLKKISKNKLVIMVTHNPDLAKEYATRIINLKDGKIVSDTNKYNGKVNTKETIEESKVKTKKTKMSRLTALTLSFNNLMTKKGRTILVSFAGSIGIIGIALILALSTGFQNYIDKIQEDTLTSYPLTIMEESTDITGMLLSMSEGDGEDNKDGTVKEEQYISSMLGNISSNDLKSFKKYLEDKPYKQFEDLAIIYKLNFNIGNNEKGSATVTLSMMERLGFTKEELHQFAIEKFPLNAPCSIENLSDALRRTEPDLFADLPESPLTIVTNKEGVLGAGSVFCPGVLEKCTNVMNGNFYVLPSSIHEMLICREGDTLGLEKLKEIVCVANETEVRKEEFLSDNVYHYDWKEKVFELAEKYEARMKEKAKQSLMGNLESKKHDVARDDHLRRNQDIGCRRTQGGSLCL